MKAFLGSTAWILSLAAAAHAQGAPPAPSDSRPSRLGLGSPGFSYGSGWGGYGYGPYFYGGGLSYGSTSVFGGLFAGGASGSGVSGLPGGWGSWAGLGYGGFGGSGIGANLGSSGGHGIVDHRRAAAEVAGPLPPPDPTGDRLLDYAASREIDEARRRLKLGDYHGAVDLFRGAVTAQTQSPLAQAWFAVGLAISGDGKNADKALRAAIAAGLVAGKVSLADAFRDDRERAKVVAALGRVGGSSEGGLAAAFALWAAGEPARLTELAAKDPAARQLLPKP